jgi:hypothetical protein
MLIYLIGSLRNPKVGEIANELRAKGYEVFDDWLAAGPDADDCLLAYEKARGHNTKQALMGYAARHIFEFDRFHLERADVAVLVLPAGKSGHLELGWFLGKGKNGYILLDEEPPRVDIMYQFATGVCNTMEELFEALGR